MKKFLKLTLLTVSLMSQHVMACDIHGKSGFMPETNLKIPVGLKSVGGINEVQFNRVMDKMQKIFSANVAATGKKFVIERRWTDGTVNAHADQQTAGVDKITMFGGLARHPETTEDAMALVACHELGHHLGGAPKKIDVTKGVLWASNEGQADYWGVMKCLRKYFEADDNVTTMKNVRLPNEVIANCSSVYTNAEEIAICQRSAMAGLALGRMLNSLTSGKSIVSLAARDRNVVTSMYDGHPQAQCRVDTYFQGALCDRDITIKVSDSDPNVGVCTQKNGDTIGIRPLCWFKP